MQMSLVDVLITTVVSMGIVFIMLTILMYLMEGSSWVIRQMESKVTSHSQETVVVAPQQQPTSRVSWAVSFDQDELARVAALVALTAASEDQPGKHFEVLSIEKKVS